jgi:hypothetical protein
MDAGQQMCQESALASPLSYEGQPVWSAHIRYTTVLSCKLCVTARKIYSRRGRPRANVLALPPAHIAPSF